MPGDVNDPPAKTAKTTGIPWSNPLWDNESVGSSLRMLSRVKLLLNGNQFHLKDQGAIGRNVAARSPLTVGELRRDEELPFRTFLHQLQGILGTQHLFLFTLSENGMKTGRNLQKRNQGGSQPIEKISDVSPDSSQGRLLLGHHPGPSIDIVLQDLLQVSSGTPR